MPQIGDVLDAISVLHRTHRTPHARLRMTAHAVRSQQAARVANAAVDGGSAGPVQQPGVHLRQLVIHREPDGLPRIGERRRFAKPQLDFIARGVGFHFQEVLSAGLQQPVDFGAMSFHLLVDPFIGVRPLAILFAIPRVEENLRDDKRIRCREIGSEEPRLLTLVFDSEPIQPGGADLAVVEILNVVRRAGDVERLIPAAGPDGKRLRIGN